MSDESSASGESAASMRTPGDVAMLAQLLHETSEHHDAYEKTHEAHDWWDWYAAYLDAREHGDGIEAAVAGADRYMDEVKHVKAL